MTPTASAARSAQSVSARLYRMSRTRQTPRVLRLTVLVCAAWSGAAHAAAAGQFMFVQGDVQVIGADGRTHAVRKGDPVQQGDKVVTAAGASAQIRTSDGGTLAVRPSSTMAINLYRYDGQADGTEKASYSLISGGLRAITGLIGKTHKQNYEVHTPTATIGVRGTDWSGVFCASPADCGPASHGAQNVSEAEPTAKTTGNTATATGDSGGSTVVTGGGFAQAPTVAPGLYVDVISGAIALSNPAGAQVYQAGQFGFVPSFNQPPVLIPRMPALLLNGVTPPPGAVLLSPTDTTTTTTGAKDGAAMRILGPFDQVLVIPKSSPPPTLPTAPIVIPTVVKTGTDMSGNLINTTDQTITGNGTTTPLSPGPSGTRIYPSPQHVSVGFVGRYDSAGTSNYFNAAIGTAQTSLTSAQSAYTTAGTALGTLNAANVNAASALATAQTAYNLAYAQGAAGDPIVAKLLAALSAVQSAAAYANNAAGSTTNASSGMAQFLNVTNQSVQTGNRLVGAAQSLLTGISSFSQQQASFSQQSASYAGQQLLALLASPSLNGSSDAGAAVSTLQNNAGLIANALTAAAAISPTTQGYAEIQAAANALQSAQSAVNLAATAAQSAASSAASAAGYASGAYPLALSTQSYLNTYNFPQVIGATGRNVGVTLDGSGALQSGGITAPSFADDSPGDGSRYALRTAAHLSDTVVTNTGGDAASGLSWGRWQGGTLTIAQQMFGVDASGHAGYGTYQNGSFVIGATDSYSRSLENGSLHWITGPANFPDWLPRVLTGTASYSLIGGTSPTDTAGNLGTLTSAALDVNFTTQRVHGTVGFTMQSNAWQLSVDNLVLQPGGAFGPGYCTIGCTPAYTVTKNGAPLSGAVADMSGALLGTNLNRAALHYAVSEPVNSATALDPITGQFFATSDYNTIQGVAALAGPQQDPTTPYRVVGISGNSGGGVVSSLSGGLSSDISSGFGNGSGSAVGGFGGGEMPAARLVDSAAGLKEFLTDGVTYKPIDSTQLGYADRATVRVGTATNQDVGATLIGTTTVSWGRWEGGAVDVFSADGSTKLGTVANNSSVHWLTSSALTADLATIPLTGTATYALAGATRPTDSLGNKGTLNSVTLKADFTNQKASAAVNVSFNSASNTGSYSIAASGMPIAPGGSFNATGALVSTGTGAVTSCSGPSCGGTAGGQLGGRFIGPSAAGAGMSYQINTTLAGSGASNAINGVAVLRR